MAATAHFITHPEVLIDPAHPVTRWRLSDRGIARMRAFAAPAGLAAIWASTEAKAIEAAGLLAAGPGLPVQVDAGLGENDRSATGYLPPEEFERTADAFFGHPHHSIRGWERAVDAQRRVTLAVDRCLAAAPPGDVAFVAHGAVGALLLAALLGRPVTRAFDQPGAGGGNRFTFDIASRGLIQGWRSLEHP